MSNHTLEEFLFLVCFIVIIFGSIFGLSIEVITLVAFVFGYLGGWISARY